MSKQAKLSSFFKPSASAKAPKAKQTVKRVVATQGLDEFSAQVRIGVWQRDHSDRVIVV